MPALQRASVHSIISACFDQGLMHEFRFFVLARGLLARVMNELLPLQIDGRAQLPESSPAWHSQIIFQGKTVIIKLRTRKNAQGGATITRHCSCTSVARDVWCCFHALRSQCRSSSADSTSIWPFSKAHITDVLKRLCQELSISWPGFHAFRRGMAQDILESGKDLSFILRAGGWRSKAFMDYLTRAKLDARESLNYALADSDSDQDV